MKHKPITMTASDFYNDPKLIENFTRSKTFESCRRLREVLPGFPSYHETVNEFHAAWLIFLMAKTGKTSTRKAFVHGILSANELKMGDVLFVHWLAELLLKPERIKNEIKSNDVDYNGYDVPKASEKTNFRINVQWMYTKNWEFQSRCEWVQLKQETSNSGGVLYFQEVRYKPLGKPYSFAIRWSMFDTDSYDTRIYTYEQDMVGAFSLPAYSDRGDKYYVLIRYRLMKGLDVWLRYSRSVFLQAATKPALEPEVKEEFKMQLRWQF